MISMPAPWRTRHGAGRKAGSERISASCPGRAALDVRDDVHDVAVVFEEELVGDLDRADRRPRGPRRCAEIEGHQVLGALLRVGQQFVGQALVLRRGRAARPGAGDRADLHSPSRRSPEFPGLSRQRRSRRSRGSTCRARGSMAKRPVERRRQEEWNVASKRWHSTTWKMSPAGMYSLARSTIAGYSALGVFDVASKTDRAESGRAGRSHRAAEGRARARRSSAANGAYSQRRLGEMPARGRDRGHPVISSFTASKIATARAEQDRVRHAERIGFAPAAAPSAGPCRSQIAEMPAAIGGRLRQRDRALGDQRAERLERGLASAQMLRIVGDGD